MFLLVPTDRAVQTVDVTPEDVLLIDRGWLAALDLATPYVFHPRFRVSVAKPEPIMPVMPVIRTFMAKMWTGA